MTAGQQGATTALGPQRPLPNGGEQADDRGQEPYDEKGAERNELGRRPELLGGAGRQDRRVGSRLEDADGRQGIAACSDLRPS